MREGNHAIIKGKDETFLLREVPESMVETQPIEGEEIGGIHTPRCLPELRKGVHIIYGRP